MTRDTLHAALRRILRPLIRLLLRSGVSFVEFAELAKRLYVELAMQELTIPGRKASVSRAAVLTGLSRKEVQKLLREPPAAGASPEPYNRAARVVAGWVRDPDFHTPEGAPAVLAGGAEAEGFNALVRRYSGDIPPRAILDELVRVDAVRVHPQGEVELLARVYPPQGAAARVEGLGTDVADLIETLGHNLEASAGRAGSARSHGGRD